MVAVAFRLPAAKRHHTHVVEPVLENPKRWGMSLLRRLFVNRPHRVCDIFGGDFLADLRSVCLEE